MGAPLRVRDRSRLQKASGTGWAEATPQVALSNGTWPPNCAVAAFQPSTVRVAVWAKLVWT